MSDLLDTPYDERDYRTLTKANLEKMYVLLTDEWYPAQQSHTWFLQAGVASWVAGAPGRA